MAFDHSVKGSNSYNLAGGRITLEFAERFLRHLQEHGEIYVYNASPDDKSLVEMWAELSRKAQETPCKP